MNRPAACGELFDGMGVHHIRSGQVLLLLTNSKGKEMEMRHQAMQTTQREIGKEPERSLFEMILFRVQRPNTYLSVLFCIPRSLLGDERQHALEA